MDLHTLLTFLKYPLIQETSYTSLKNKWMIIPTQFLIQDTDLRVAAPNPFIGVCNSQKL